jgi:hypothetical protein
VLSAMTFPPQVAFAIPSLRFLPKVHMFGPSFGAHRLSRSWRLRLTHSTALHLIWMLFD